MTESNAGVSTRNKKNQIETELKHTSSFKLSNSMQIENIEDSNKQKNEKENKIQTRDLITEKGDAKSNSNIISNTNIHTKRNMFEK